MPTFFCAQFASAIEYLVSFEQYSPAVTKLPKQHNHDEFVGGESNRRAGEDIHCGYELERSAETRHELPTGGSSPAQATECERAKVVPSAEPIDLRCNAASVAVPTPPYPTFCFVSTTFNCLLRRSRSCWMNFTSASSSMICSSSAMSERLCFATLASFIRTLFPKLASLASATYDSRLSLFTGSHSFPLLVGAAYTPAGVGVSSSYFYCLVR